MPRTIPGDRFHDLVEAATAVFLVQGYRRTQMAEVAERMGVAKGTVYLYAESKEALFDAVLRHADRREPVALPESLPVPTPPPGAMLDRVRKRVTEEASLPALAAALERRRVNDLVGEVRGILHELYALLSQNRIGIKLLDRCSADYPELGAVWFGMGREGALAPLTRYLEERVRRRRLAPMKDPALTARIVLETVAFWAVHRHWDPSPRTVDDALAEGSVVEFLSRALRGAA